MGMIVWLQVVAGSVTHVRTTDEDAHACSTSRQQIIHALQRAIAAVKGDTQAVDSFTLCWQFWQCCTALHWSAAILLRLTTRNV